MISVEVTTCVLDMKPTTIVPTTVKSFSDLLVLTQPFRSSLHSSLRSSLTQTNTAVDLVISWDSNNRLKLITTPSKVSFMWFRSLHLLSNPNRLVYWKTGAPVEPEVNRIAMRGIYVCVEQMMSKGRTIGNTQFDLNKKGGKGELRLSR